MPVLPSYAEFRSARKITPETPSAVSWSLYEEEIEARIAIMEEDGILSREHLHAVLAHDAVLTHMGKDWYDGNIKTVGQASRGYLYGQGSNSIEKLLTAHRIQELGRRLHQLQAHPWFGSFSKHLARNQLSGSAFEADILAALMVMPGHIVRTQETGQAGADFDITVDFGAHRIPVEVKAKDDTTSFSPATVKKTIKKASSQLPSGEQAVLFMRIPFTWVGRGLDEDYTDALFDATRQSSKVATIMTVVDKPHLKDGTSLGRVTRVYQPFKSPSCEEDIWKFTLTLNHFLQQQLNYLAPRIPF